ncbi:MAG: D-alanyl-D-alanine carboxypeptidase/D-alanyl-D-alanine-endopeptidase [Pararhodobacter sp.]
MSSERPVFRRRALLAGLAASIAAPALARAPTRSLVPVARPTSLAQEVPAARAARGLTDLLARSGVSGETALIALDAETGAVLEEHRANLRLPPASTAKAVTALYALNTLGPEHRFRTRIEGHGTLTGNTLTGDLVLRGGGDPVLQTEDLARMADALIQQGLRRVEGRFLVDDSALPAITRIDPEQPPQAGYNPAISGINLNFNRVHFAWVVQGGRATLTMDARSDREVPRVSVIDIRTAARDLPVYTHDLRRDGERWTVAASALSGEGSRWLPVRRPAPYAGDVLRALLLARGCHLPEPQVAAVSRTGPILAETFSAPLTSIVRGMLRYSTNLTAECLGLHATLAGGAQVRALEPSAERMSAFAARRYGADGLSFVDHSGLGDGSRVSPRAMAQFLLAARSEGMLQEHLRDHPMRDDAGRPQGNHPITVQAKTGTLNFVSALAGYAQMRGGRSIVFSIVSADMARRRAAQDVNDERPAGARTFASRARSLQQALIERWARAQS